MSDVTRILSQIESGDMSAVSQLWSLVYDELRRLAASKIANEKPGQTLQGTALVHEAFIRLVDTDRPQDWSGRNHFFSAAAEAMRRILVDVARRKSAIKHGGLASREEFQEDSIVSVARPDEVLAVHESLDELSAEDPVAADLVKLHYFAGFSLEEASEQLGMSRATAYRTWNYARAWLRANLEKESS